MVKPQKVLSIKIRMPKKSGRKNDESSTRDKGGKSMPLPQQMQHMLKVAETITHGAITEYDRTCPYCETPNLTFSFTAMKAPLEGYYGLFLVCSNCRAGQHYTLSERPPNFREELVSAHFQRLEDEAVSFAGQPNHDGPPPSDLGRSDSGVS